MYTVNRIDNLILVRITSLDTFAEAQAVVKEVATFVRNNDQVVAAVDFRAAKLFSQEVTDLIVSLLRSDNPRIRASAHMLSGSALSALQIERMVRESNNPNRRTFREARDAEVFVASCLTEAQRIRLRAWFIEAESE